MITLPSLASGRSASLRALFAALALAASTTPCPAAIYTVTNISNAGVGSLRQAIIDANASGAPGGIVGTANTVNVTATGTINLQDALPLVFSNLTLNGNGITLDGGSLHRCLFVNGLPTTPTGDPQAIAVTLHQLHLNHCRAKGGDGGAGAGSGGGGGMGAGGALFIGQNASATLVQVSFDGNSSVGGNGGVAATLNDAVDGGGGGGGLGGAGSDGATGTFGSGGGIGGDGGQSSGNARGGGGGIGGIGGNASSGFLGGGGGGGFGGTGIGQIAPNQGFVAAGSSTQGGIGGSNGGGGGGGTNGAAGNTGGAGGAGGAMTGDGGGGGAGGVSSGVGGIGGGGGGGSSGDGGFGGGGGSSVNSAGPRGGFGGGGGGVDGERDEGGTGGFGGGGGGGYYGGSGGFGGGAGAGLPGAGYDYSSGGGGGSMGASIFIVNGGMLSITGAGILANGTLTPGFAAPAGGNGSAFGTGLFLQGNGTLVFNLPGLAYTMNDDIADATGSGAVGADVGSWGIHAQSGSLVLGGNNTHTGTTSIDNGATLEVNGTTTSAITINPGGVLGGSGVVATVLNDGTVAPGNSTSPLATLTAQAYDEVAGSTLRIAANAAGANAALSVTGNAALSGKVHFDFSGGPALGSTYTFFTVTGTIGNSSFAGYDSNMPSVFGEIVALPHSIQFVVIANDLVFRSGFESGSDVGACRLGAATRSQFAALPAQAITGLQSCVPPFTVDTGFGTITACQSSMCQPGVPGCPAVLRAQSGTLTGSLAIGAYSVDTPIQIDPLSVPLTYSGALSGSCTLDVSGTAGRIVPIYDAEPDSLNGAYIYAMPADAVNSLTTSLSGCAALSSFLPLALPTIETQFTAAIQSAASPSLQQAGVGQTICPN
jgi:hypothetical protein